MATERTIRDLINHAYWSGNMLAPGDGISATDVDFAFETLQDLLAEWGMEGLTIPALITETFNLAVGTISYTVGQNGAPTLNTVRPEKVVGAYIRDSSGADYGLNIINDSEYRRISEKSSSGERPEVLCVKYNNPNATFLVWPAPSAIEALYFISEKGLNEPTTLTESMINTTALQRSYFNALKWALAVELLPAFEKEPTPNMMNRARISKGTVINLNLSRKMGSVRLGVPGEAQEPSNWGETGY